MHNYSFLSIDTAKIAQMTDNSLIKSKKKKEKTQFLVHLLAKQNVNSYMEIAIIIALILLNGYSLCPKSTLISSDVKVVCPMISVMEALQRVSL